MDHVRSFVKLPMQDFSHIQAYLCNRVEKTNVREKDTLHHHYWKRKVNPIDLGLEFMEDECQLKLVSCFTVTPIAWLEDVHIT